MPMSSVKERFIFPEVFFKFVDVLKRALLFLQTMVKFTLLFWLGVEMTFDGGTVHLKTDALARVFTMFSWITNSLQ